jgi:hypothetical protein
MTCILSILHVDVYPKGNNEYQIYTEAWIENCIQVRSATWEDPAEFAPGLCWASTYVEDKPPTDQSDLHEFIHELNRSASLEWTIIDDIDGI